MEFEDQFALELEALGLIEQLQKERDSAIEARRQNLPKNVPALRNAFSNNKNVKSDLKKSSAFVKKVKAINAEGIQQCIRDTETLNLTQFISEIVGAVLATGYKATDVGYIVKLCICLHQKYEEFTDPLVSGLKSGLLSPEDDAESGKKKRIQIRLAIELYQAGLFNDDEFFNQVLRSLLGKAVKPGGPAPAKPIMDLPSLSTFVKYGYESFFGFAPRKVVEVVTRGGKTAGDIPVKLLASVKVHNEMKALLSEAYQNLCNGLVKAHNDFRQKETKCEKDKLIHGSLSEQKQQEFDSAQKLYEKLLNVVTSISEYNGEKIPELIIEKEAEEGPSKLSVWEGTAQMEEAIQSGGYYGDPETRSFYEDLPDLLSLVPLSVLGLTPEQASALRAEWDSAKEKEGSGAIEEEKGNEDIAAEAAEGDALLDEEAEKGASEGADRDSGAAGEGAGEEMSKSEKLQQLFNDKLPECINRQKADDFCVSYCYLNSKGAKKQLIYALARIPRSRMELCSTYARIAASLSRLYPDLLTGLLDSLRKEFYGMLKTKKQLYIESKIRNVRYQAELVKFRVVPPIVAFRMMKALLADFSPTNVQLLVAVMETCGRFLFLLPYTHEIMKQYVETMLRLRHAKHLDLFHQTLIDSAYFAVQPPERKVAVKKEFTIVQQYAKYLILEKLADATMSVDSVITSLRKLPWLTPEEDIFYHLVKACLKLARTKYISIPNLADCLSGLMKFYPNLVVCIVDKVWEEVQRALDSPFKREMQRMLGMTRLMGELYNYTAITSSHVFDFLYHLINFGHALPVEEGGQGGRFDPRIPFESDLPNDLFRTQVICEMLNTIGLYFTRGAAKERMQRFLTYFQRYLLTKQMIPIHVEFTILDTFDLLEDLARKEKKKVGVVGVEFTRYEDFDTVQKVIEEWEAAGQRNGAEGGEGEAAEGEEEGDGEEGDRDEGEREEVGGEGQGEEGEEESESDDESDGDSEDSDEEDEEEAEAAAARALEKMRLVEEDEDFDKAFKAVMQESVSSVTNRYQDVNRMVIPAVLPKPKNTFSVTVEGEGEAEEEAEQEEEEEKKSVKHVPFKLLSRDMKGRVETRQLLVPENNSMAVKLVKAEEEQRREKEMLKQRVLQINSMNEETDEGYSDEMLIASAYSKNSLSSSTSAKSTVKVSNNSAKYHPSLVNNRIPADTLDLDAFLAEANKAEIRKIGTRGGGPGGGGAPNKY